MGRTIPGLLEQPVGYARTTGRRQTLNKKIMDMETLGTIPAPGTIRFERRLNASLQEVWAYLTESDLRGQWLAKGEMELVPGGTVDLHFRHSDLSPLPGTPPDKYKEMSGGHHFRSGTQRILRMNGLSGRAHSPEEK